MIESSWQFAFYEAVYWARHHGMRYKVYGVRKQWGWTYYLKQTDEAIGKRNQ